METFAKAVDVLDAKLGVCVIDRRFSGFFFFAVGVAGVGGAGGRGFSSTGEETTCGAD